MARLVYVLPTVHLAAVVQEIYCVALRMIINDGRGAAAPEDEKGSVDLKPPWGGDFRCEQVRVADLLVVRPRMII